MEEEKGVTVIAYKKSGRTPRFLVLERKKNWEGWELPKGHLEESHSQTARQELQEEAGVDGDEIEALEETDYDLTWEYEEEGEKRRRRYRVFVARVSDDARIDTTENPHDEHERGHFLSFRDAKALLTHQNQVELLEKVGDEISLP